LLLDLDHNRAGKIPFVVSGQGQEATQIGMAYAMEQGDISSPYYRLLENFGIKYPFFYDYNEMAFVYHLS
jgi:TPP-dependent pyruvate/acetoin dehydrogenase alpha subunit